MKALLILLGAAGLGLLYWLWLKGNEHPPSQFVTVSGDPLKDGYGISPGQSTGVISSAPWRGTPVPSANPVRPAIVSVESLSPTSSYGYVPGEVTGFN